MPLTQNIGLEQLSKYFHLPIQAVAKELGVCATVLKKICRRNGIPRWPHRKIKSLDKMIASLQAISPKSPEDADRIKQEIASLTNKKRYLISNPNSLGTGPHVKIKKSTPLSGTAAAKAKKKVAATIVKQEPPTATGEHGEEAELSATFLEPDVLDWEGLTWQEPQFAESELGSVPYDSPLGRALLMKPYPLDQLPKLLSPVHTAAPAPTGVSRPLSHMAMPSGGVSSFQPYQSSPQPLPTATTSAFSAKLPDIGSTAESVSSAPSEKDHAIALGLPGHVAKLEVLEPNLLLPSVNPLPFTTQYGIHPLAQTFPHQMIPSEWRDNLPTWYSDEYHEYALSSRALVGLPPDFAPSTAIREDGQPSLTLADQTLAVPSTLPSALPLTTVDGTSSQVSSDSDDVGQTYIVAGNEAVPGTIGSTEPALFDLL